jgi:transposase
MNDISVSHMPHMQDIKYNNKNIPGLNFILNKDNILNYSVRNNEFINYFPIKIIENAITTDSPKYTTASDAILKIIDKERNIKFHNYISDYPIFHTPENHIDNINCMAYNLYSSLKPEFIFKYDARYLKAKREYVKKSKSDKVKQKKATLTKKEKAKKIEEDKIQEAINLDKLKHILPATIPGLCNRFHSFQRLYLVKNYDISGKTKNKNYDTYINNFRNIPKIIYKEPIITLQIWTLLEFELLWQLIQFLLPYSKQDKISDYKVFKFILHYFRMLSKNKFRKKYTSFKSLLKSQFSNPNIVINRYYKWGRFGVFDKINKLGISWDMPPIDFGKKLRPSEVSDNLWARVEPLIPQTTRVPGKEYKRRPGGGRKPKPNRLVFEGIVYVLTTGIKWLDLPKEKYGDPSSIHKRFVKWDEAGVFEKLWENSLTEFDKEVGVGWDCVCIDGSLCKAITGSTEAIGKNPTNRGRNGTKIMRICDINGVPLSIIFAGANVHDSQLLEKSLKAMKIPPKILDSIKHAFLDKGFQGVIYEEIIKKYGYVPHISGRDSEIEAQKYKNESPKRWIIEVCHSWFNKFRKLIIRYEKRAESYKALNYLAAAIITLRKIPMKINIIYGTPD